MYEQVKTKIELRRLRVDDGEDVYRLLQSLPVEENGFSNACSGASFEEFKRWLVRQNEISLGKNLEDWMVEQTTYWLYVDGVPVGMGKLRHRLTDKLRVAGGHVGYAISPAHRGKGYGKQLLRLLKERAEQLGIDRLLVTVYPSNLPSLKVALANGGVIEDTDDIRHHIWFNLKKRDCGFTSEEGWFRLRACAIIVSQGRVLVAKNESDPYFYSVGGGIHLHESAEQAVVREVFEETGEEYEVDRLYVIHENFFVGTMTLKDQRCHEVALYFLMKPKAVEQFTHQSTTLGGIAERVVWLPISDLDNHEVYPTFLKQILQNPHSGIRHIITHE